MNKKMNFLETHKLIFGKIELKIVKKYTENFDFLWTVFQSFETENNTK